MKYIHYGPVGWEFDPYFNYVESIKTELSPALYEFASDYDNYNLTSHTSLHDAWLEEFSIREVQQPSSKTDRVLEISSTYLGPFHDLKIHITYRDVHWYELINPQESRTQPPTTVPHGDLLLHEIRVASKGLFEHELVFSRGGRFLVCFEEFEHLVEPITRPME